MSGDFCGHHGYGACGMSGSSLASQAAATAQAGAAAQTACQAAADAARAAQQRAEQANQELKNHYVTSGKSGGLGSWWF